MAAADTSVLVRLLTEDDAAQARLAEVFLRRNRPLWISTVVLVETCWVLASAYGWKRHQLGTLLEQLLISSDFVLQSPGEVRTAMGPFRSSRADFSDCLALELARAEARLPFASFDRAVVELPGVTGL